MKQTVTAHMFIDAFRACGREDNFSVPARCALFEYFEEMERDTGEEIELDPVAVCCDWTEYATAAEAAEDRGWEWDGAEEGEDEDDATERRQADALEWLRDRTTVLEVDDGNVSSVVIQQF